MTTARAANPNAATKRPRLDPRIKAMGEAQLQDAICDLALLNGWKVSFAPDWMKRLAFASMRRHPKAGRRWPPAGLPDLLLARDGQHGEPGRLILAELKSHVGRLKPEQQEWLETVASVENVEVFVWRPADWVSGEIEGVLK